MDGETAPALTDDPHQDPSRVERVPAAAQSGRRRRPYFVPGVIAFVVLLVMSVILGAGDLFHSSPSSLSGSQVAQQVALAIQFQENTSQPPVLSCPATLPAKVGYAFTCVASERLGAARRTVEVTETGNHGQVRWSFAG